MLNLLEQQIDAFHEGQPIDFELISNVLHYMADYADQVHHRLEDQLFDPLKDRSDPIGATVRQVMGQHPHLIVRTRQFEKTAEGVIHDAVVTREEFEQQARAFIGLQREHLRLEEEGHSRPTPARLPGPRNLLEESKFTAAPLRPRRVTMRPRAHTICAVVWPLTHLA
ncbi:MAG: hemerythrin domain-containing protein [Gammaproteobacteria bacterium]|nr:hemerythrin domain-containing protein [Gammaproteobacteria bacterium]